jgi:23S rRNA (uracil-5-)-methyltransferase RumA
MTHDIKELETGKELELKISSLAYGGDGIAYFDDCAIYIPYALPSSIVSAVVVDSKNGVAHARIRRIIKQSPYYSKPACQYFGICGGCDWMNMPYKYQLEHKVRIVREMIEKTGGIKNSPMLMPVSYETPLNYRNRAEYRPVLTKRGVELGFFKARSHEIAGVDKCLLMHPMINEIAGITRMALNENTKGFTIYNQDKRRGYLRHVTIRVNTQGKALVTFVVAGKEVKSFVETAAKRIKAQCNNIYGIVVNFNLEDTSNVYGEREKVLFGKPYLIESAAGVNFKLEAQTFFQVNAGMLEKMSEFVFKKAGSGSSVLDLYGGVGALTLPSASKFREITIVEAEKTSTTILYDIAKHNNIRNISIINSRVEDAAERLLKDGKFDAVVVDPPRSGMNPRVVTALRKNLPGKLIYISCNPASFARDLASLKGVYYLNEVIPLDQFAQTYHVELMAEMTKR